jgi:hypothetical protein
VQGQTLASPHEAVAHTAQRPRLTVAWSGGSPRDIEVLTGPGHWDRSGEDLVEGRWGPVQDGTGTHREESCLTTEITMRPQQMVDDDPQRWAVETPFHACREALTRASTTGHGPAPVLRLTPGLFG